MQKSNRKFEKIITVLIALAIFAIGIRIGLSQSGNFLKSVVEPGSMTSEASYIIFTDGSTVYARNGTTGEIEFQSDNASYVIQSALNALTNGRIWQEKVFLKGNFTLTAGIILPSYTILEIDGKLERGFNGGYMIDTDSSMQNEHITINGGSIDGVEASYTGGGIRLQACRFSTIEHVLAYNHKTDGIAFQYIVGKQDYDNYISESEITYCSRYCINMNMSDCWVVNNIIDGIESTYTVYNFGGANHYIGNHMMTGGLSDCLYIDSGSTPIDVIGGEIENCRNGITSFGTHTIIDGVLFHLNNRSAVYLPVGSKSSTITGCSFYDNSRNIQGYSDIILENTVNNTITGNVFSTPTTNTRSAVRETGTADYNIISGNTIDTANYYNPVIEKVGSHTVVKDNTGYNLPQESVESASYIISTDGTNYYAKNGTTGQIDFSSTSGSIVIQDAINAMSNNGTLHLKSGIYSVPSQIEINRSIIFEGEGEQSTVLAAWNLSGKSVLSVTAPNVVIQYLMIDSSPPQDYSPKAGIRIANHYCTLQNVFIKGIKNNGSSGYGYGIWLDASASGVYTTVIRRVTLRIVNTAIAMIGSADAVNVATLDSVFFKDFSENGLYATYSNDVTVIDGDFETAASNTNAIFLDNNTGYYTIINPFVEFVSASNVTVYMLRSPNNAQYAHEIIGGSYSGYSVLVNDTQHNSLFRGAGFENSGNSTVSNNDWIAHGLATTPSIVTITPRSNATVWVNNRNATHFQVGVSSGTVTVDWHAEV